MRPVGVLILSLLLLSGCAGAAGSTKSDTRASSEIQAPGEVREDAATLTGLVLDESELPVAGAVVGLLESKVQAAADAAGAFKFTNLAPGTYTLSVAALGFQASSQRVTLDASAEKNVLVHLVAIAISVPYHEIYGPFQGYFSCKLGLPVQSTACGSVLVGPGVRTDDTLWANDKAFQWWNLTSPNWRTIIGELTWTQGTFATTQKLRSSWDHERFGSHWFCGQEGHNPLYYRYEKPDNATAAKCLGNSASATTDPKEPVFGKPLVTGFRVPFGAVGSTDPQENPPVYLAFQQKVTSYMDVFYGEPAPDLWHAQADV